MTLLSTFGLHRSSQRSAWMLPGVMLGISLTALLVAELMPSLKRVLYFVPYTFLGNSLAPLPYDGAVVYLVAHHSVWLVVAVATAATLVIEAWNMEVLTRILARDGTRGFRNHQITRTSLTWYSKAPFWSLVATCVLPIIPHYPMRFLAVLAAYPMWKYQLSVVLGRGTRYALLAGFGLAFPIPAPWILVASLVILAVGVRGAQRINRQPADASLAREVVTEDA